MDTEDVGILTEVSTAPRGASETGEGVFNDPEVADDGDPEVADDGIGS